MSTQQKVIKYVAIALAVWLTVSIIGGILGALGIFNVFFGNDAVSDEMTVYSVSSDIRSLDKINHLCNLIIHSLYHHILWEAS